VPATVHLSFFERNIPRSGLYRKRHPHYFAAFSFRAILIQRYEVQKAVFQKEKQKELGLQLSFSFGQHFLHALEVNKSALREEKSLLYSEENILKRLIMPKKCFNPLNEVSLLKEHLHFTIDSLGLQGPFLHTPANPSKNKLLLCKLDRLDEIVKRPNY
jgi:hypothetical protein